MALLNPGVSGSASASDIQYTDGGTPPTHPIGTLPIFNNSGTWAQVSASQGLPVNVVGGGAAGGTSSTFNAAFPSAGTAVGATDGTNMKPLSVDGSGYLQVNIKAGSGSGLSVQDAAAWTTGSSNFVPGGGVFNDSAAVLTSGQQGTQRLTNNRAGHVNIRSSAGTELATSSNPLQVSLANTGANATAVKVDGSAVTQPVSGTFWQATQPISGTITANAGTNLNTSALALESGGNLATVAGGIISQEATTSGVKGLTIFGAVTTNAPTYVTTKSDALSLDTSGLLRMSLKDTPSNTNNINVNLAASAATVTVTGTVTTTPPSNASTNIAQFGGSAVTLGQQLAASSIPVILPSATITTLTPPTTVTVTQATASSLNATVVGTGTFVVQAALNAETTKVIGVVRTADGSGNLLTSTAQALDINIKSGSIANTTFAATQSGTWNIGTLTSITNTVTAAGTLTNNNAAPAATNFGVLSARANAAAPSYTEGNQTLLSTDLAGNLRVTGSLSVGGTTDETGFTAGTSSFTGIGGVYNDNLQNLAIGQQGAARLTSDRKLRVDLSNVVAANNQQINGNDIATTNDGTQLVSIAGPTGDPIDTVGNALRVSAQTGQSTMNSSIPVTVASNQSTIPTVIAGSAANSTVFAPGELRVSQEPHQLFNDTFDNGLDTTNKWKIPVSTGTGLQATNSVGTTVLNGGTTTNSFSLLESAMSFQPTAPGWLYQGMRINIEYPVLTTGYRFWGVATTPGVPTISSPIVEGAGWDIGTNGRLSAVMYATGTRNLIADLSAAGTGKQPTDSSAHKYFIWFRGDQTYWAIDSVDNVVASTSTGAPGPNINGLPIKLLTISNGGTAVTITLNGLEVADTSGGSSSISDGLYHWRQAMVTANSALKVDASASVQPVMVLQSNGAVVPFDNIQQIGGSDIATTNDGTQLISLAGPTGDALNTIGNALEVAATRNLPTSNETSTIFSGSIPISPQFVAIVASSSGATTLVAAMPGKRIRVLSYVLTSNGTVNVKWQSHTLPTDLTGLDYLIANTGVSSGYSPIGHFQTLIGEALDINLSGSIAVGGHLTYIAV